MKFRAVVSMLPAAALVAFAVMSGCSSSDSGNKVTNPPIEPFESGDLSHNGSFQHTFATVGTFGYRCRHHPPNMVGTISVTAGASDSQVVTMGDNFFPPASPIKPGGYVRWINGGNSFHTVTRP